MQKTNQMRNANIITMSFNCKKYFGLNKQQKSNINKLEKCHVYVIFINRPESAKTNTNNRRKKKSKKHGMIDV